MESEEAPAYGPRLRVSGSLGLRAEASGTCPALVRRPLARVDSSITPGFNIKPGPSWNPASKGRHLCQTPIKSEGGFAQRRSLIKSTFARQLAHGTRSFFSSDGKTPAYGPRLFGSVRPKPHRRPGQVDSAVTKPAFTLVLAFMASSWFRWDGSGKEEAIPRRQNRSHPNTRHEAGIWIIKD